MKTLLVCLIVLLVSAASPESTGGVKTVVFPLQPLGVDTASAQEASRLLRAYLTGTGAFTVVHSDRKCHYRRCASQIGSELDVPKAIIGKLAKLGESVLLTLSLIDVQSGRVEFSDRLRVTPEEDLNLALERAAVGLSRKKRFRQTAIPERIEIEEASKPRSPRPLIRFGARAGWIFPLSDSFGGSQGLYSLSCLVQREAGDWVVEGEGGMAGSSSARTFSLELFVHRRLNGGGTAPYLGVGLGGHSLSSGLVDVGPRYGLELSLGGGIAGVEAHGVRLIFDWRYGMIFVRGGLPVQQGVSVTAGLTTGG